MNNTETYLTLNNVKVPIDGERNLLELIRKAGIDLPTFCYHSELSVYGACRLCIVEIEGKGITASCAEPPRPGMIIKTSTKKLRDMRRMTLELLLANHKFDCPSCEKAGDCRLLEISNKLGVRNIRFGRTRPFSEKDCMSDSLIRDPDKCILCGDCVRYCAEIQGIGAIDFAYRGEEVKVTPAFNKSLAKVDCVNCGGCAAVCPTGAILARNEIDAVLESIDDENTLTVVQIAPAVPAALGEEFGLQGEDVTGKIITALRMIGFDRIYSTAFGADMTVLEESAEFIKRKEDGRKLPLFTSCCPAWVKYAEQFYPEILENVSSCMSPQEMVGSLAERIMTEDGSLGTGKKLSVISVMPCTAKKYEKNRPELSRDGRQLVNNVITTRELAALIKMHGLRFAELKPSAMDLPMGYSSGAGTIFGNSGGVAEAVLRYTGDPDIKVCTVQGLKAAGDMAEKVKKGECEYDLIEVMACPGGCIGGAGQPVAEDRSVLKKRAEVLRDTDRIQPVHTSCQNPFIDGIYEKFLGGMPGSGESHKFLHTGYQSRRRIEASGFDLIKASSDAEDTLSVSICVGTSCFLKGSQKILADVLEAAEAPELKGRLNVQASFCSEHCEKGPNVHVGDTLLTGTDSEKIISLIKKELGFAAKN